MTIAATVAIIVIAVTIAAQAVIAEAITALNAVNK
jgi:hypothetical protein